MTGRRAGWTSFGIAVALAILMSIAMPSTGIAQTGEDAADRGGGLRVALDVSPHPLVYGVVHEATIRVANGTATDRKVKITALLGEVAHFAGGGEGVHFVRPDQPEHQRKITWPVMDLPADETVRVSFRFLPSWDTSGDLYLQVDAETVGDERLIEVAHLREAPRLPDGTPSFLGQYGGTLVLFLLFIVLQVALFMHMRRKGSGLLRALAQVGAVVLLLMAGTMIHEAFEPWLSWKTTTCEILDVRYTVDTISTSSSSGTRMRSTSTSNSRLEIPLLTLRFDAEGKSIVSTGFRNQASSTGDMGRLAQYRAGTTTDCYYDPDDPGWVVVVQDVTITTIAFSLFFALSGCLLAWLGLRRRKTAD